ncbi:XdhC family protein [Marinobacter sp. ANT_B65]|uniref:XdhC family protein n=1 Tax=Marinobacter sp. ANT_B65 TaxID=2039467 RepID=UPI000BBE5882|nr:XdhC family protein [Marinobacter sp. ANT_B65]PCM45849.1 hypothetical protein CPA50_07755 [Marinobacter sp. ANT_B65]
MIFDDVAVLQAALDFKRRNAAIALITLIRRDGSAPRPLGSQMVVTGEGECAGSLTGTGCADSLIVHEACAAIKEGIPRTLRLGAGSPYLDIRLPCGSGIELYIDPLLDICTLEFLLSEYRARRPVALETNSETHSHRCFLGQPVSPLPPDVLRRWIYPRQRLIVIGQGLNAVALSQVAVVSGYDVSVFSPDEATLTAGRQSGADAIRLTSAKTFPPPPLDAWTAAVTMFHDHDREIPVLQKLLESRCFYLGALGSRRTHSLRLATLKDLGLTDSTRRLHGPVGLDIGAQSPAEIALSILAEITHVYRTVERPLLEVGVITTQAR